MNTNHTILLFAMHQIELLLKKQQDTENLFFSVLRHA